MKQVLVSGRVLLVALACIAIAPAARGALVEANAARTATAHRSGPSSPVPAPAPSDRLSYGRFKNLGIYAPVGPPKSFALLLSGADGWDSQVTALARQLAAHGSLLAGIDLPKLEANLQADGGDCVFLDGDLENLSHFLQAYYHLPTYLPPFLVGYRAGAVLAYASLVQAPPETFAGALTIGFSAIADLRKPLCKGSGLGWSGPGTGAGIRYLPATRLEAPWVNFQAAREPSAAGRQEAARFMAGMQGAALVTLSGTGADYTPIDGWSPQFLAAFETLVVRAATETLPAAPAALGDLPVVEVAAQPGTPATDMFAIIMSGDGGWAGLDKAVAEALSAHGIPVVGLDSLRYFWSARTPEGLARDTDQMIRYYLAHLAKKRVLLIGYSQGADVLPFAVNRMPAATRATLALAVLMGMSEHALFEFHVSSWISNDSTGPETLPEVNRISGIPVLCIYGDGDKDSLCPKLDAARDHVVKLPGGHHFNGDYAALARVILATAHK